MRNISTKADNVGDTLPASDFNANLKSELQNVVTSAGFTLDPEGGPDTDVEMFGKSIIQNVNAGQYYQDSGTANSYVLARVGTLKQLTSYIDGVTVVFKAGNANTGASTINVDSLGAKALRDNTDTALVGGEIIADGYVIARYNSSNDRFEIVASQSSADTPLPSTGYYGQSLEVNSGEDGYNLVGPLYSFKNKLINPWMEGWRREGGLLGGTGPINITSNDTYSADRYTLIFDGTADVDVEQVALGATIKIGTRWVVNGLKITVNTNSGNTYLRFCQRIENVTSLADLATVLQTYIQGSGNLTIPIYLRQDFGSGGSSDVVTDFSNDLSVTTSMQKLLSGVTIPDLTGKTIVDTTSFVSLEYDLINLASTDYIIIPFHQFEPGENESFPEFRTKSVEEDLMNRYYWHSWYGVQVPGYATTTRIISFNFNNSSYCYATLGLNTVMRANPSRTYYDTSGAPGVITTSGGGSGQSLTIGDIRASNKIVTAEFQILGNANGLARFNIELDAEL